MRLALKARVTRPKLTVVVDESTSLSKKPPHIVHLRTSFDCWEPLAFVLDLLELENTTTDGITGLLKLALLMPFFKNVSAFVMVGKKSELALKTEK